MGLPALALALGLAACGGGGGGGSTPSPAPPPPGQTPQPQPTPPPQPTPQPLPTPQSPSPRLDFLFPTQAEPGDTVTLYGSSLEGATSVSLAGLAVPPPYQPGVVPGSTLVVTVPRVAATATGPASVTTPAGTASGGTITLSPGSTAPPAVTAFVPSAGVPGETIGILGTNLKQAQQVLFGNVPAASIMPVSSTFLKAVVPSGAPRAPITVSTPYGPPAQSSQDFNPLAPSTVPPRITSFQPESGEGNPTIALEGSGLASAQTYGIGTARLAMIKVSDTRALVWFNASDKPVSGPITVTSPLGSFTTATPYTVLPGLPVVQALSPSAAAGGSTVTILGRNLDQLTSITFGGIPTGVPGDAAPDRVRVEVPRGAPLGFQEVVLTNLRGSATATFRVQAAGEPGTLTIAKAYLTQGVQDGTVPLAAGKDAMCRVFLLDTVPNAFTPTVRITLAAADGSIRLARDVPCPGSSVPLTFDENTTPSWNLPVPGDLIQPGMTLRVQVAPGASPPQPPVEFPADGSALPVNVVQVPALHLLLRPLTFRDGATGATVTGNVDRNGRTAQSWLKSLQALYPIGSVDLQVGAPFDCGRTLGAGTTLDTFGEIVDDFAVARLQAVGTGSFQVWYGVYTYPIQGQAPAGIAADIPRRGFKGRLAAIGFDGDGYPDGQHRFGTLAHELGHLKGRYHAPCGGAGGPDPNYPFPPARLGGVAYDVRNTSVVDSNAYSDLMGYCYPRWISTYTTKGILAKFQEDDAAGARIGAQDAAQPCIVVDGLVDADGNASLEPPFEMSAQPDDIPPGDWKLLFLDAQGNILQSVPFQPQPLPDMEDRSNFILVVPMTPAMQAGLASVQVAGPTGAPALRTSSRLARAGQPREPEAVAWTGGRIHVSWDAWAYPRAMVVDPRTQEVRAMSRDGEAEFEYDGTEVDLVLSDGARTVRRHLAVAPGGP